MAALITLNPQAAGADSASGGNSEAIEAEVKRIVRQVNKHLAPFEQIRRFKILDRDFSLENGELTPTMKLRRSKVLENFKREIAELYSGREES
jgi:long-chain acyl-CoA synthetase